jgi:uncharacterized protein YbjT (DUF2867 family)
MQDRKPSASPRIIGMTVILFTGASGNVGRHLVRCLGQDDVRVIAARSKENGCRRSSDPVVDSVRLDFRDRTTWSDALADVDRIFLMRPPAISDLRSSLNPFIDSAYAQGLEHIVFLSVAGAETNRFVPHRKVEDHLREHGENYTNLRPGFFAQNLGSAYRPDIVEDDRIYIPAGTEQPVNWIDTRDIAEVAALMLTCPSDHRGKSYTLAGPGAVHWIEVANMLSETLGRPIRYEPASFPGYLWHLWQRGQPAGAIIVQTLLHVLLRFGHGATEDSTLEQLLGRPGRTIEEYIDDHYELWW